MLSFGFGIFKDMITNGVQDLVVYTFLSTAQAHPVM